MVTTIVAAVYIQYAPNITLAHWGWEKILLWRSLGNYSDIGAKIAARADFEKTVVAWR